jgi:hypothetical protein
MVPLPGFAAGPERPQLVAARHSEKTDDFSGLQNGPVKGMTFREARAVPELGRFFGVPENVWQTRLRNGRTTGLWI